MRIGMNSQAVKPAKTLVKVVITDVPPEVQDAAIAAFQQSLKHEDSKIETANMRECKGVVEGDVIVPTPINCSARTTVRNAFASFEHFLFQQEAVS